MRYCIIFVLFTVFFAVPVQGTEIDADMAQYYTEEEVNEVTRGLLDSIQLGELDQMVKDMLGNESLSFSDMIQKLVSGELDLDLTVFLTLLGEVFINEFLEQKDILLQLLLLVFISALILNLSHLFEDGQMTNISFYMVYLMVFALLMKSFQGLSGLVESVIGGASAFMRVLTPAYFLALTASNGGLTAAGYYQLVLITISLVQWILLKIALPGVQMYVVLGIVNYISGEDYLSRMAELIKTIVIWLTKSVTALVVGLQVLQNMVAPALDMVKRGMVGKTISAIPGVGNVLDSVTEMAVGCAVLVRNCIGVVALVVLILFGFAPLVQLGVTTLLYRLVTAIAQPVSEKRFMKAISIMAEGSELLLRILVTGEILFLLTIAIVAAGGIS